MRGCDEIANQEYLLGTLTPEESARREAHLESCAACSREVEEFRALFAELADLPMPAVPEGIADSVVARVRRRTIFAVEEAASRPLVGAVAGGVVGLILTLLRHPLVLFFGRGIHQLLTDGSSGVLHGLRLVLRNLLDGTVLLHTFLDALLKVEPLTQQLGEAAKTIPGSTVLLSFALFLATALLIGRAVTHLGREKLGHARH